MFWNIRKNVKYSSGIFILSSIYKDGFSKKWRFPLERIFVVPHAFFSSHAGHNFPLPDKNPPISKKPKILILFFGRIDAYKGMDVLISAFEKAVRKDHRLFLRVCGNGPFDQLVPKIPPDVRSHLDLDVRWIGEEEIGGIFKQADFLVLPFRAQAQSGVIAMAYAFGKPVITSRLGGLVEQVVDGETGLLCEPGNASDFAKKIISLSQNDTLFEKLCLGIKKRGQIYSWENSAKIIQKAFEVQK